MPSHDHPLSQRTFSFDPAAQSHATLYEPSDEILAAFERLEDWLLDPRTEKPRTQTGEEALHVVGKALLDGSNSYVQKAEDMLESLARHNARTDGDDIAPGTMPEGPDFQQTVEELLDALAERVTARAR